MGASTSLFTMLRNSKERYDEDKVRKSLIIIKSVKNTRLADRHKEFVMFSLSDIIVKNVNNFFNLIKHVEECRLLHEKDDIVAECYVIMQKCMDNFDVKRNKNFFWYYNKSLSMGLFRMTKRMYKTNIYFKDFADMYGGENRLMQQSTQQALDPLIMNVDFTPEELDYLQSKLNDEKITDYLIRTNFTRTLYYRVERDVKFKLKRHYDEYKSEPVIAY